MEVEDFNYERTRKIAHKYYLKLISTNNSYYDIVSGMEIIPYDKLWENILSNLKQIGLKHLNKVA